MKFSFTCCVLILLSSINVLAKSATVHITVKNFAGSIDVYDPELRYDLTKTKASDLKLDSHQSASYSMVIDKSTYLDLYFSTDLGFNCTLFVSPGDELFFTIDFAKKQNNTIVTGKGSNNNQPEIFALTNMNTQLFKDDVTPYRLIAALNKQFTLNKTILTKYIKTNKPSKEFIKAEMDNLRYFAPLFYYESSHNNAFGKPEEHQREWHKIQDSLFSTVKINNDNALTAYNYTQLIDNFLKWESSELWNEYTDHPVLFYKKWFHCDTVRGKKLFNYEKIGILNQKVIDKYFTGEAAEYGYGQSIKYAFSKADYSSTVLLFNHFKEKYPKSIYIKGFSAPMAGVVSKQRQVLNSKIIFFKDNGTKLNTFNDVLALIKGKTVLIDMWGTWCGPCRTEIEKDGPQLRAHFKEKNITYLYIANWDSEKEWKKQISYFQMEGMHILANPKLTNDIRAKVKSTGYPTYIIVKKDGSYKQTVTRYPVNVQALIKEIEAAGR